MDDLSRQLRKLGDLVSDVDDRLLPASELDAARQRWLAGPSRDASPPERLRPVPAMLAAAACAVALVAVLFLRRGDRVSFDVGSPAARGAVGAWVAADQGAPLPLHFSEGTELTLAPGAHARVTETTAHGATVLLERGNVAASVVHTGPDTQWHLHAGPFDVRVTGTKFDASWDPVDETFALAMQEGTVVVQGPLLQPGREIRAGERVRVSVHDGALEVHAAGSSSVAAPPAGAPLGASSPTREGGDLPGARAADPPATSASACAPLPPSAGAPSAAVAREPGWRELCAGGKFNEALSAAERAGFAQELERASSHDLATLADAARYASRPDLARQAVLAQRRRFGARGASAFVLGKIAADQMHAGDEAVRWFETYLREEPNGALAEQALGRILELTKRDPAAGRASAERYLARYPQGAHAALARSLVPPTTSP